MMVKPTVKGVIGGVPIDVEAESFLEVEGVFGGRKAKEKENSRIVGQH